MKVYAVRIQDKVMREIQKKAKKDDKKASEVIRDLIDTGLKIDTFSDENTSKAKAELLEKLQRIVYQMTLENTLVSREMMHLIDRDNQDNVENIINNCRQKSRELVAKYMGDEVLTG